MSLLYRAVATLVLGLIGAVLAGDAVQLDSLVDQCSFTVDGNSYGLCPLLSKNGWVVRYERQTPPSILTGRYWIKVDGKLPKNESLDASRQCPDGTTICLTTYTRYNGESYKQARILNTIPVAGSLTGEDSKPYIQRGRYTPGLNVQAQMVRLWNATEDTLKITMNGGYYVYQRQFATFHFVCDKDHDKQALKYLWSYNGEHIFSWRSPHACAQGKSSGPSDGPSAPDNSGGDSEEELIDPSLYGRSGRALWTLIALTTLTTAVVAYLIYFPPRPFRRFISRFLKRHPSIHFRVGETVLVRWAQEEMDLDEDDPMFVNGDDISQFLDDEEGIPLKPSPHKGGVVTYGST
ncbi:hypothetical protein BDY19DRAFT_995257 [Irpex rosettiformis]|uniref:Uncharacterized protein n=1 Tax=Irpex rosettiformis TaxID=378272 RepID=A0ACB8TYN8_9APHY|nr:hypothetical protein BDY19DRAFT_995257 [Irpex rosettiformis]